MWVREDLKSRAKDMLRKYYWVALLVTLVAGILMQGINFGYRFSSGDTRSISWDWNGYNGDYDYFTRAAGILFGSAMASLAFVFMLIGIAYTLFVSGPIETGMSRYFVDARQGRSDFTSLFYAFRGGRYMDVVKAMGWRMLFTFLWSLLLIIPGIWKSYAYCMVPWIMAENPNMNYQRALRLSMEMTMGHKWEIFVLDLSFLGWYLLGMLLCCVGVVFVNPYYQATKAELYAELKYRALNAGLITEDGAGGYTTTV